MLERLLDRAGLTISGAVLVVVAPVAWLIANSVGGRSLFILVYCGVAVLVAAVITARRRRTVEGKRSDLVRRAREGQVLQVEISVSAPRRLAMFTVVEMVPEALGATVRVTVEEVKPGADWTHRYSLRPGRRGVYKVGPMSAVWTDPLGLANSHQVLAGETEIIVHPAVERVFDRPLTREMEDPPIRPPRTKPWPTGFEFYGMRDYVAGDDLRRVVWKAVARTGKLLVREAEQGITDRVNIVIDTDRDWHRPGDPSDTFEAAIRVAASVGAGHIKDGFSVSLFAGGRALRENLRGPRARNALLDALAYLDADDEPLSKTIDRLLGRAGRNAHNVVITPNFDARCASRARLLVDAGASVLVANILWEDTDPMSAHRATEIGAQVVQVRPGAPLSGTFAHSLGAGIR